MTELSHEAWIKSGSITLEELMQQVTDEAKKHEVISVTFSHGRPVISEAPSSSLQTPDVDDDWKKINSQDNLPK